MWKYTIIGLLIVLVVGIFWLRTTGESDPSSDPSQQSVSSITHVHGAGVHIGDPSKLYIATHQGLLVLENDTNLYLVGEHKDDLMGFSIHPLDSEIFLSSGHPSRGGNIGFQVSVDGGTTWQKRSDGIGGPVDFHAMAVSWVNPNLVYGYYHNGLQRSTDGGITWELLDTPITPIALMTHTSQEEVVYAATQQGLLVSKDKGLTWEVLSEGIGSGVVTAMAMNPTDSNQMLAFAQKLNGLGKSVDGGKTWTKGSETFSNETVLYFAYSKSSPRVVYALTQKNSVYKSEDGGDQWRKIK